MNRPGNPLPDISQHQSRKHIRLEGNIKQALETGRNRLLVTAVVFSLAFMVIAGRLVDLTLVAEEGEPLLAQTTPSQAGVVGRADIVDRNGVILATSLPTVSLYADPHDVPNPEETANRLVRVMPELDRDEIAAKLSVPRRFVWLSRNLTPQQHYEVNRLGIPGLFFQRGERRVYPHGRNVAHVLGLTDVDGRGIAGIEQYFDRNLREEEAPLRLSIDLRVQDLLREELYRTMNRFRALGAAGLVTDVATGEVVAMVSLPDFDPNKPATMRGNAGFNRAAKGVYEMGSTFKLFTTAVALDTGTVGLDDGYDTSEPIRVARFTITDYHGKNRWQSVPEILIYSSNIGAAKMAIATGAAAQRSYLEELGLLSAASVELPEVGTPLAPRRWREINTMTVAYGHGIAVSPLQLANAVASVVNGGTHYPPTLLKQISPREQAAGRNGRRIYLAAEGTRVFSTETSRQMRTLMRRVVQEGTGKNADVPGYAVGGKTGTAEKNLAGHYRRKALISSFVGAFPMDAPRFVVLAVLDEPVGDKSTFNYATGGWIAAPVVRRVVERMAPLLGIGPDPRRDGPPKDRAVLASLRQGVARIGGAQLAAH